MAATNALSLSFPRTHRLREQCGSAASSRRWNSRGRWLLPVRALEVSYDPLGKISEFASQNRQQQPGTPTSLTLFSPSKINVFLRITRKREDGYHDLASLFHAISLGDVIKFSESPSTSRDSLTTNASGVPLDASNLILKALSLFRQKTGSKKHFWVHLDKRVPTGAGLGGGSGNAATALWAANVMSGGAVGEEQLREWGAEIGSDVPFFFSSGAAFCTGRGEEVQDMRGILDLRTPLVLMKPAEACSTAEVYKNFHLEAASSADPLLLLEQIRLQGISQATAVNDLEPPAFNVLPSLKRLKQRIQNSARGKFQAVIMSGSGSTIVGVGSPDPPPFLLDDDSFADVFISEAAFIQREAGEWYRGSSDLPLNDGSEGSEQRNDIRVGEMASGVSSLEKLRLPFSYEA